MPSYEHLLVDELNFDAIAPHVQAAAHLGVPYTEEELNNTAEVAYRQAERIAADIVAQGGPASTFDKQAIALIAYLQRLGTDLFRTPEPEESESTPGEESAPAETEAGEAVAMSGPAAETE
jgi:cytochrome c oxidase cbb3-type subunit I/II